MPDEDSFTNIMTRLRGGDEDAAAEVFHRFAGRLVGLARRHLGARLLRKLDPEDVLDSVYRSFFRRNGDQEFTIDGWDGLWALLTVLTVRKCGRWREYFYSAARDVRREEAPAAGDGATGLGPELLAGEPSPAEGVVLADLVESLLRGLKEADREIVALRLQGHSPGEIATQLCRPPRTVFRVLDRVKKRLRLLCGEGAGQA
jgi:RNA polymerase sigma-70 factor (ECF subfamily)